MKLLFDTDIFIKLGLTGLLLPALDAVGVHMEDCARLPALPQMLAKGKLVKMYGAEPLASLEPLVSAMAPVPAPPTAWLDPLINVPYLDSGEAALFATAAASPGVLVGCGDKRAIAAVAKVPGMQSALDGRVICFEAILFSLCSKLGQDSVRAALQTLSIDGMVRICFSSGNPSPLDCLRSYFDAIEADAKPLKLWLSS